MKPLIRYIGSKKSLLKDIGNILPDKINNYYELFLGGGSVYFYINNNFDIKKNYINDYDKDVINIYKQIKKNKDKVIKYLKELTKINTKNGFEKLVNEYNNNKNDKIKLASIYIYMTKRSYNGRLNYWKERKTIKPNYAESFKNHKIYNESNIDLISNLLKKTIIKSKDYKKVINFSKLKKDDFIFLDPPYLTLKTHQSYKHTFDYNDYNELFKFCNKLNNKKVNFMITTNCSNKLKTLFKKYNIKCVNKQSIISKSKGQEKEMIITNY